MSTDPSPLRANTGGIDIACPLCATDLPVPAGPIDTDPSGRRVQFQLCRRCQVLVPAEIEPSPDGEHLDLSDSARQLADGMAADAPALAWNLAEHLPAPADAGPVVDLGMGRGALANALQSLGYTVTGCEPSAFLCQMARASYLLGPDTLTNTDPDSFLASLEADSSTAAAVVLWHVVDRHPDPLGLLRRAAKVASGGLLFVEFPVARADRLLAEQRVHPTPATLLHLADELNLVIRAASIDGRQAVRVVFAVPHENVVDLDRAHNIDIPALETAYRAASPVFADQVPGPMAPTEPEGDPVAQLEQHRSGR
ncbi:MAG: methyltransferase domain-containing protein [Actinomycetota bacterium]